MSETFAAVSQHLTVEPLEAGELVYDSRDHGAHHLDALAASVRRACVERRSLAEISATCNVTEDVAQTVLARLTAIGLVDVHGPSMDRRSMLRKSAGVAIGAGAILSVVAPTAALAASPPCPNGSPNPNAPFGAGQCSPADNQCCSGSRANATGPCLGGSKPCN